MSGGGSGRRCKAGAWIRSITWKGEACGGGVYLPEHREAAETRSTEGLAASLTGRTGMIPSHGGGSAVRQYARR